MKNENDREPELTALEWQAFRYLAGELNDTDLGNFETQLEHDENAQQALVQISILLNQLSLAQEPGDVVRETAAGYSVGREAVTNCTGTYPATRRPMAAWILTIASAILVGLSTWVFNTNRENSVDDGSRLAEVWVEGVGEIADEIEADFVLAQIDATEFSNDDDEGWLLSALMSLDEFDRELTQ